MKGIVLISHGDWAKGMAQSATFFFGSDIEQMTYRCLQMDDSPDAFAESIQEAIDSVDTGDGVIILADLFGGTPCNKAALMVSDSVDLIAGANFPLLMELLGSRDGDVDIAELADKGRTSLVNVKEALAAAGSDDEDE